jgi:hypothetical protein
MRFLYLSAAGQGRSNGSLFREWATVGRDVTQPQSEGRRGSPAEDRSAVK